MTDATSPRAPSPGRAEPTERDRGRTQLVAAAEQLFAERGIDGVSLREITRVAGHRNNSALQYHFGDRTGLVRAVVDKHRLVTEPHRHQLLDDYEGLGRPDLHALAAALVVPLAAKLADPDGGRAYLRINAEITTRPVFDHDLVARPGARGSMRRWHALADAALSAEDGVLHFRFPALRFAFVELGRRAAERPRRDDRLFTSHLVDMVVALLETRPSPETTRLVELRRARRREAGGPG